MGLARDPVDRVSGTTTPPPLMGIDMLVEHELLVMGQEYWVEDEEGEDVWTLGEVVEQEEGRVTVNLSQYGRRREVDRESEEMFPKNPVVVADMTALHHIHEPGILHNLKERSRPWRQTPYTFMGTILLAVNPLKAIPSPPVEKYMDQPLDSESPHPYAVAELAYRQMRMAAGREGTNQSIVVSGESGAGKTETVKTILRYLARRSLGGVNDSLEAKVLESSPILESFGNARTMRNDNSSRFGKFLKLKFSHGEVSYLEGASIEPYLLEKSRVLAQGEGERNFHILYEMVAGANRSGLAKELKLGEVSSYSILSRSGVIALDGVDDAERFKAIQEAFSTVGVDADSQMQVWKALSGLLHLSTLSMHETDHQEGPVAAISDRKTLETTASLLGVEVKVLESMLTLKVVPVTRGEVFTKHLGLKESVRARDAAIKSLYEAIFLWVVRAINTSLGGGFKLADDDKLPFIGLLDIFGFENFGHKNNLEQLLINYANESLQSDFNRQVFENELRVYEEEGIEVKVSPAVYNTSCLRMLTGKRDGVLPILDDVCSQPLPSDARYLERLHIAFSRRQGQDITVKIGSRDVGLRRPSIGSDDGRSSAVIMRNRLGSDSNSSASVTAKNAAGAAAAADEETSSIEWLGRGSSHGCNDMRTEQHESFWVNHYASKVLYTVDGWVERNMDSVPQSFTDTMLSSDHQVVFDAAMGYSSGMNDGPPDYKEKKLSGGSFHGDIPVPRRAGRGRESKALLMRRTVAGNFLTSMQDLSATLIKTTCGFVRCIKPNAAMDFGIFDSHYVVEQLRCLGVLRTCEVLKVGMPTRVSYGDLKQSLGERILEAEKLFEGEPEKSLVAAILWAFDVPPDAFRLGTKRVFFRAGQIAVLNKILNETPPDKLPWVLSRLRLALANRKMARIAAEEAEDALAEAEASVMEAEAISSDTKRSGSSRRNTNGPMSPGSSADQDMRVLVSTVDKARRASSNSAQVKSTLAEAESEGVGEYAAGAREKIQLASESALVDIMHAGDRATDLEKLTTLGVFGVDGVAGEAAALRNIHSKLANIREGLAAAERLWRTAEDSADKCQAEPAVESAKAAKAKAEEVVSQSREVANTSKNAIEVARRQRKAKDATTRATDKAQRSFRSFQVVVRQARMDERRARANNKVLQVKVTPPKGPTLNQLAAIKAASMSTKKEALTKEQKQQRHEDRQAASAEAAAAIASASKEEETRRLELLAAEKERQQELEEEAELAALEAATAAAEAEMEREIQAAAAKEVSRALPADQANDKGTSAARPGREKAGEEGYSSASDTNNASKGGEGNNDTKSGSTMSEQEKAKETAVAAAKAAIAAVEAITGIKVPDNALPGINGSAAAAAVAAAHSGSASPVSSSPATLKPASSGVSAPGKSPSARRRVNKDKGRPDLAVAPTSALSRVNGTRHLGTGPDGGDANSEEGAKLSTTGRREEAVAALAAAKEDEKKKGQEWSKKVQAAEDGVKHTEGDKHTAGTTDGSSGASRYPVQSGINSAPPDLKKSTSAVDVRARAKQLEEEEKKKRGKTRGGASPDSSSRSMSSNDKASKPEARSGPLSRRSMMATGVSVVPYDSASVESSQDTGSEAGRRKGKGDTHKVRPWDDEDDDDDATTMGAKDEPHRRDDDPSARAGVERGDGKGGKGMGGKGKKGKGEREGNGVRVSTSGKHAEAGESSSIAKIAEAKDRWHSSPGMPPWRSPERAPECGWGPTKKGMVRTHSFGGDTHSIRDPWERSTETPRSKIGKGMSLEGDFGDDSTVGAPWLNSKRGAEGDAAEDGNRPLLEAMLFKDEADDAEIEQTEVAMKYDEEEKHGDSGQSRRVPRWKPYCFRLAAERLTQYPPRRSSGLPSDIEVMELTEKTITSYTNTKNCFCVRTGEMCWFLLARGQSNMKQWMTAINLQAKEVFQKKAPIPEDDYWGSGRKGRFFYRMVEGCTPQWILSFPMAEAPRTGDGLFPGEVIEVEQVLSAEGATFLRLASNRGWTYARNPKGGGVFFEDLAGGVSPDTEEYSFPSSGKGIIPILHGPGLRTQATGETIQRGERAKAAERFTPVSDDNVVFIKLADNRGWVPMKISSRGPSTVLRGW